MGLILLLIASILKWILTPVAYCYGVICAILKGELKEYNTNLAIAKDQYGNALCEYLFNQLLITKGGYKFGNRKQTISAVLGYNKIYNTLTKLGLLIVNILNNIEKNHVENAIINGK